MSQAAAMETPSVAALLDDLESERLQVLGVLDPAVWNAPTPCPGWSVRDQVAHLCAGDDFAGAALAEPTAFGALAERASRGAEEFEKWHLAQVPHDHDELTARWRQSGARLRAAASPIAEGARVPWFGPSMSVRSLITARLMETWAHGHDLAEAVGTQLPATDRLRHVAVLGVRARPYGFLVRGLKPPIDPVRVDLELPSGRRWVAGPATANGLIRGSAEDFCLVLARRRRPENTALTIVSSAALGWMRFGQLYAGRPGEPPAAE